MQRSPISMRSIKVQRIAAKLSMCGVPISPEQILEKHPTDDELNFYYTKLCLKRKAT